MACVFCRDPAFQRWVSIGAASQINENGAKAFILSLCRVGSRNELDASPEAAERFHELVRKPFVAWKEDAFMEAVYGPGGYIT